MVAQILLVQPNCEGLLVSLAISGFSLKDPGVLFVLDLFVHFSWREKILDRFEPFVGQPKSRLKNWHSMSDYLPLFAGEIFRIRPLRASVSR